MGYSIGSYVRCHTPQHIIDKMIYRRDTLAAGRHEFSLDKLRRIVLLDFDLQRNSKGQPIPVFT